MCYFIFGGIPNSSTLDDLNRITEKHYCTFLEIKSDSILKHLPNDWLYIMRNGGCCDCDLAHLMMNSSQIDDQFDTEQENKEIAKMKRKGWSNNKIKRALDQKKSNFHCTQNVANHMYPDWEKLVTQVVEEIGEIGIFIHFDNGGFEEEEIYQMVHVNASKIGENFFSSMEKDTFYHFSFKDKWKFRKKSTFPLP